MGSSASLTVKDRIREGRVNALARTLIESYKGTKLTPDVARCFAEAGVSMALSRKLPAGFRPDPVVSLDKQIMFEAFRRFALKRAGLTTTHGLGSR